MFNFSRKFNSFKKQLTPGVSNEKFSLNYDILSIKQKNIIQDEATLFIDNNLKINFIKGEILNKLNSKLINYTLLERPKDLLKVDPDELNFVALDEVYLWFDSYEGSNKARQLQRNLINVSRKMNMVI